MIEAVKTAIARLAKEDAMRETWLAFKAARERWWRRATPANFRAYKAAERRFLESWGADDVL